ncbi:flagellar basal-body MS-ring/collar protein FliF [Sphingomonas bacterium]|uniref:flagellar basal-body MS-ring/collar protein FliF n=1 Tax=Sphingomonas bacterium TaxID=1895847 RepID=UPI0015751951|nr:flagellar basal-body MS-ring/collar protein FliF [Sphingomonas bacterium]
MSALIPSPAPGGVTLVPERFANPLRQIQGVLAQPAVRRSLPMVLLVGLIAAATLAWMTLSSPTQKTLFTGLPDADKAAVTAALDQANIKSRLDDGTGALTVGEDDYSRARMLLAGQGLPKAAPGGYAILDQLPMGVSRAVEGERLRQARETELARSIQEIDAVADARVHLAMPESSVFVRDSASPSASVMVKLNAGRSLDDAQVRSIVNLVASSVPGMKPDAVTIVDQMGALLTRGGGEAGDGEGTRRLEVERRTEDKVREQVVQLLTPLVGAGNFTTQVQADVNLDETQATRESYDKAGTLRAETGNWTGNQKDASAPGGIPGALSNTPPAASSVQQPTPVPTASPSPAAGAPAPDAQKQSDSFQRAYDLGREVSVTRAAPGGVKRLSVAVLLRDPDGKGAGGRRSPAEVQQITDLVKSAVGFDQSRNDVVTVVSRKFAGTDPVDAKRPWYDNSWLPMLARNLTAIAIALMVLMLGVRPLLKTIGKKQAAGTAAGPSGKPIGAADGLSAEGEGEPAVLPAVTLEQIETSRSFDERVGAVRGFTRDNPARAALAVRDMIRAEPK